MIHFQTDSHMFRGNRFRHGLLCLASGMLAGASAGWLIGIAYGSVDALLISDSSRLFLVSAYFSVCGAITSGIVFGFLCGMDPKGFSGIIGSQAGDGVVLRPCLPKHCRLGEIARTRISQRLPGRDSLPNSSMS